MRDAAATRLTLKGQVVIPKTIRTRLGWKPGTRLRVDVESEGAVTLRPANDRADFRSWLDEVTGCAKVGDGDPISALEEEHRREVEQDARRRP